MRDFLGKALSLVWLCLIFYGVGSLWNTWVFPEAERVFGTGFMSNDWVRFGVFVPGLLVGVALWGFGIKLAQKVFPPSDEGGI